MQKMECNSNWHGILVAFLFVAIEGQRIFPSIFLFLLFAALAITLSFDCLFYCCFFSPEKKKYWRLFSFCETENEWSFKFLLFVLIPFLISLLSRLIFFSFAFVFTMQTTFIFFADMCRQNNKGNFSPEQFVFPPQTQYCPFLAPPPTRLLFPPLIKILIPFSPTRNMQPCPHGNKTRSGLISPFILVFFCSFKRSSLLTREFFSPFDRFSILTFSLPAYFHPLWPFMVPWMQDMFLF